jgi:hypothetical protein
MQYDYTTTMYNVFGKLQFFYWDGNFKIKFPPHETSILDLIISSSFESGMECFEHTGVN